MSVILTILKIIGMIILIVLGLVLVILALVLLVPICYQAACQNRFGMVWSLKVSWLLGAVSVSKGMDSEEIWLKLFGIPLRRLHGKKEQKKNMKKRRPVPVTDESGMPEFQTTQVIDEDPRIIRVSDEELSKSDERTESESSELLTKTRSEKLSDSPVYEEKGNKRKITPKAPGKKKGKKKRKKKKKEGREEKKSFSFNRVSGIIGFVRNAENKRAFRRLFKEIGRLLRYLAPRKIHGSVTFGTGDPSSTGLIVGGISLFPLVYRDDLKIRPDFEEKIFLAEGELKGRLQIVWLGWFALRIYRDRELMNLWRKANKLFKED